MIKNLFLFFTVLVMFATLSKAQVSSVTGQYLQDNNLLLNPGFESGIGKWTNSAGTFTADYSVFVQGKASGKVVLSSQALDFYQDSTMFASQLADGMQAILTVKIKSSVAGVRVCPRQAGSVITSLCVSVQGNDKWGLYQIPFVTGATSQGISINSNSTSITGTVYVDESYVGVSNILNSSSEAKLAGEAYFAGTTSCNWTRTSTTVGAFGTVAACPGPTIVRQNLGAWQTTDSDLPRVTVNNLPAGTYKAQFIFGSYQTSASVSAFAINDGSTTCEAVKGNTGSVSLVPLTIECSFNYTSAGNRVFELYGASASSTINVANDQPSSPRASIKFILEYYGSNSTYTTTAGINNADVFSAKISAAGVVLQENANWINGDATVTNTSTYGITFTSNLFTTAPNCVASVYGAQDDLRKIVFERVLVTSSGGSWRSQDSHTSTGQALDWRLICQKQGADFVASKTITGTFKEVVKSQGSDIVDIQSVLFGTGANCESICTASPCTICNQVGSKITSVSRAGTGIYRINGVDGLRYNCTGSGTTNGYIGLAHIRTNSTSGYAEIQTGNLSGSNADSANNSLICIGIP